MSLDAGFDRGIDFKQIKDKLIYAYNVTIGEIRELDESDRYYSSKKRKLIHRLIYILISLTQLCNGSRISEAVAAFIKFQETKKYESKATVKIAKSESIKYKKDTKEQYTTKPRYRHIIFPGKWIGIPIELHDDIDYYLGNIDKSTLKKRVLDYLLKHQGCNTHSLRYACINHLLYEQKKEPSIVAKFVGHSSMAQLVRYTQNKEVDKLFDLDI